MPKSRIFSLSFLQAFFKHFAMHSLGKESFPDDHVIGGEAMESLFPSLILSFIHSSDPCDLNPRPAHSLPGHSSSCRPPSLLLSRSPKLCLSASQTSPPDLRQLTELQRNFQRKRRHSDSQSDAPVSRAGPGREVSGSSVPPPGDSSRASSSLLSPAGLVSPV